MHDFTLEAGGEVYKPSETERERVKHIYDAMYDCIDLRDQPFNYFDNQSLEDYINESVKRWNSYIPPRDAEDWRTSVFMPDTRNKILAILSFVAAQRQRAEFTARDKYHPVNKVMSQVLKAMYDYSMDQERGDMKFNMATLENLIKGTVVVWEGYSYSKRTVKKVTEYDPITDEMKYEEEEMVDEDNCVQRVIPLEDVYIPNFYESDIQKQPYVIIREEIDYKLFLDAYSKWDNVKYVKPSMYLTREKEGEMFFYERWTSRTDVNTVEVLHFYDKWNDIHNIVANGVLLTKVDRPIIFDHKQYPLAKTVYEPMAVDFFYGKSLPQKILSEQDVVNTLYNMLLDRTYLSVMPWFLTGIEDEIEESEIGPLQRIQVSDVTQFREANIQQVGQAELKIFDLVRDSISTSTVDEAMMGSVAGGTATAVQQARESATRILGLLLKFMSDLTYQQAKLRAANILQFYPAGNQMKGRKDEEGIKEYRAEGQTLSDGKVGLKVVRMISDKDKAPTKKQVRDEVGNSDGPTEIVYVTPRSLAMIDYDVKIVPASSVAESKSLQKALGLEYNQVMLSAFPDMVNREKLFEYTNELFDQSPDEMRQAPEQQQSLANLAAGEAQEGEATPEVAQQLMGNPEAALGQLIQGQ
jgi:hypothetical protein